MKLSPKTFSMKCPAWPLIFPKSNSVLLFEPDSVSVTLLSDKRVGMRDSTCGHVNKNCLNINGLFFPFYHSRTNNPLHMSNRILVADIKI